MMNLKCLNVKMHVILEQYHEFLLYHALYMNALSYGDFKGVLSMSSIMVLYSSITYRLS